MFERRAHGRDVIENRGIGHHRHIVFREIDSGFEHRDQFHQLLLDRLQPPRQRALQLLRRHFRLIQSLRVDQIAHRLGLRQIDASVEKRAHGELPGLRQSRSGRHAKLHDMPQHHRRSMRRNLNNVVGRVRVRLGKVSDDDFVDALFVWRGRSRPRLAGSQPMSAGPPGYPAGIRLFGLFAGEGARSTWVDQFPKNARPGSSSCFSRSIGAAISSAFAPARRTTPIPPRPGGVAIATMVSSRFTRRL